MMRARLYALLTKLGDRAYQFGKRLEHIVHRLDRMADAYLEEEE